jgi:AmmeMemoRadiSam system protein B
MDSSLRIAYHGGSWYSDDPKYLGTQINNYLSSAEKYEKYNNLKSIIVPHAGYRFCAETAAKAFININPDNYDRVVVLGPSHHEYFQGCGLSSFENFETPFGNVKIDTLTTEKLIKDNLFFKLSESVDLNEHSIEMEMPFLKYIFGQKDFNLLPIVVGQNDYENNKKIGKVLFDLYEDPKTLFVISSDFCHWGRRFGFTYYDESFGDIWKSTENLDRMALDIISKMNSKELAEYFKKYRNTICGRNPIIVVLSIIEDYKKKFSEKKINFECAGYSQSDKVVSKSGSSVSYAAAVNFVF